MSKSKQRCLDEDDGRILSPRERRKHPFLRGAIVAFNGLDRWGGRFWFWITAPRITSRQAQLKLWQAGSVDADTEEGAIDFQRALIEQAIAGSWQEAAVVVERYCSDYGFPAAAPALAKVALLRRHPSWRKD